MEKTFVVCHMLASLDGKIDGDFFSSPESAPALKAYGDLRGFYRCQATLYGLTTMVGGYADGFVQKLPKPAEPVERADWVNPDGKAVSNFIGSMDPKGELAYSTHILEKKGRPGAHVIEVLTEQAPDSYLAYLRQAGVSYLFAGKELVDLPLLLQKLRELFSIDRLMVAGGGVVNWSFLAADLMDEFSLVITPVADGSTTSVSSFEKSAFSPDHPPMPLHLLEARALGDDVLWLRYRR